MNHLAHLALAGDDPAMLVGAFLGDFVKGRLRGERNPEIERGIRLHRAIDAFTDSHPDVKKSARRFESPHRRYTGVILDVVFDYLLARSWPRYYETRLENFSKDALGTLVEQGRHLPEPAAAMAGRMQAMNSLAGHGSEEFLIHSFDRLSSRLRRQNPLDTAYDICRDLIPELDRDFHEFYPQLSDFCDEWKQRNPMQL